MPFPCELNRELFKAWASEVGSMRDHTTISPSFLSIKGDIDIRGCESFGYQNQVSDDFQGCICRGCPTWQLVPMPHHSPCLRDPPKCRTHIDIIDAEVSQNSSNAIYHHNHHSHPNPIRLQIIIHKAIIPYRP